MADTTYSVREELRQIRAAIRTLQQGAQSATISSNAGQRSYTQLDMAKLEAREKTLLGRISRSDVRKRTAPDFS